MVLQSASPPVPRKYGGSDSNKMFFESTPSLTASLINAGSLALLHGSSIPLNGVVIAVAIGVSSKEGVRELLSDPEDSEVEHLVGGGVFAFIYSNGYFDQQQASVAWSSWEGQCQPDELLAAELLALDNSKTILQVFRDVVTGNSSSAMEIDQ